MRFRWIGIESAVEIFFEPLNVDSEFLDYALRVLAPPIGRIDRLRSAITEKHSLRRVVLVTLGVSSKIIKILEDKHSRVRPGNFAIEVSCGKAADSSANDD